MDRLKAKYVRAIILKDDIVSFHTELNAEQNWSKKMRLFKNCFTCLAIFRDSMSCYTEFCREDSALSLMSRDLRKRLEFVTHIRNKISGHLDDVILEKLVQWEPFIFSKLSQGNENGQLILVYKSLLESAINSYLDSESQQRVFKTEIDLFYPKNATLFFNYVGDLNVDSIDFLKLMLDKLDEKIEYWDHSQLEKMATRAGQTDFNLKNS